jgi:hypothetical protein
MNMVTRHVQFMKIYNQTCHEIFVKIVLYDICD